MPEPMALPSSLFCSLLFSFLLSSVFLSFFLCDFPTLSFSLMSHPRAAQTGLCVSSWVVNRGLWRPASTQLAGGKGTATHSSFLATYYLCFL